MAFPVIIGAGFGDEGKGLFTDFEVRRLGAETVVRFNGGAQAGHTVDDGVNRHVFGHFGAGSLAGASTYLSTQFIVNPLLYAAELEKLPAAANRTITCSSSARVTTVYDQCLNALAEISRGQGAHGSCGAGINETVTRCAEHRHLGLNELCSANPRAVELHLESIREGWVDDRLFSLGIDLDDLRGIPEAADLIAILDMPPRVHAARLQAAGFYNVFAHQRAKVQQVVFEGAQGLFLDEQLGEFPWVTRSKTGLVGAVHAAVEMRLHDYTAMQDLQPIYCTRSYLTRHGNGPLKKQVSLPIVDTTNVENRWQGKLRTAALDLDQMRDMIHRDLTRVRRGHGSFSTVVIKEPTIAISWMDLQRTFVVVDGLMREIRTEELPALITKVTGLRVSHLAYGPKHSDVQFLG